MQTENKNVETFSKGEVYHNDGYLVFPILGNDIETELVENPNLNFYETELKEVHNNIDNMYCVTAAAYYVLIICHDDLFIDEMIEDNQVNELFASKFDELKELAFSKFPNNDEEAIDYLFDELIETFLNEATSSSPRLALIY